MTRSTAACLLILTAGCSSRDFPTATKYGYLRISAQTSGGDLDLNGYRFAVDGKESTIVWTGDKPFTTVYVDPGAHTIRLDDVASNCSATNGPTRTVTVSESDIADVAFDVVCVATGMTIATATEGTDTPDSARVVLSSVQQAEQTYLVAKAGSLEVGRLAPGNYTVGLVVPENCSVRSGAQRDVAVAANTVTAVPPFQIDCVRAVRSPRIAYISRDIYNASIRPFIETVKLDGTERREIQYGDAPVWSPDGARLAYSTMRCGPYSPWDYDGDYCYGGVELVDPEVGNHTIVRAAIGGLHPAWAPTGGALAFDRAGIAWLMARGPADSSAEWLMPNAPKPDSLQQLTWSPDGARLAGTCAWLGNADLCLINRDGSGLIRLTNDAIDDRDPAWSPDGNRIAFTRRGADPSSPLSTDIALFDLRTGTITLLTKGSDPAWSPDGSKLVFAGSNGIFIIDSDGTNRIRLTTGPHTAPAWRP